MTIKNICIIALILVSSCNLLNTEDKKTAEKKDVSEEGEIKLWHKYDDKGRIITTVPYKGDIKHGMAKHFYPDGSVSMEIPYINNKKQGESIYYYQDGSVYRTTPYVNDKKEGVQKKYYRNGKLMAEVPYHNDESMPGLREYNEFGELLTQYPSLVFKEINKIAFENKVVLKIYLSDKSKKAEYYRKAVNTAKDTVRMPIVNEGGIVELEFYIPPGKMIMEKIEIGAIKTTRRHNPYVTESSYNLAVENRLL